MAPDLSREEEQRLMKLAGHLEDHLSFAVSPEITFLAEVLLRTVRALEAEDGSRAERRERGL